MTKPAKDEPIYVDYAGVICLPRSEVIQLIMYTELCATMHNTASFARRHYDLKTMSYKDLRAELALTLGYKESRFAHYTVLLPPHTLPPPRLSSLLVLLAADPIQAEAVLGDLDEHFRREWQTTGEAHARWRYRVRVLRSIWPLARRLIVRTIKWSAIIATVKRVVGL